MNTRIKIGGLLAAVGVALTALSTPARAQNPYTMPGIFLNYGFAVNS
jgi:hypothetical protein